MGKLKGFSKKLTGEEVHSRSKYMAPSHRFLDWVNGLGFEHSLFGRMVYSIESRFSLRRISALFLFCLFLSFLVFYDFEFSYSARVGEIAVSDIKSPISFQIVDELATEAKRQEAEKTVPPVFDFDPEIYENSLNNVYKAFRSMRKQMRMTSWPESGSRLDEKIKDFLQYRPNFEQELGGSVPDRIFEWLAENQFSAKIENILIRSLVKWSNEKIVDVPVGVLGEKEATLIVRMVNRRGGGEEFTLTRNEIIDIKKTSTLSLDDVRGFLNLNIKDQKNMQRLAHALLTPNMTLNRQETSDRRQKARDAVLPIQLSINKNQVIVNEGSIIQPIHVTILNEIDNLRSDRRTDLIALVAAALFVLLILVFFSYMRRFTSNRLHIEVKDVAVMGLVTFLVVAITKIFLFMTNAAFLNKFGTIIPATVFLYAAPVAAGSMLVGLLLSSGEVVFLFTIFLGLCSALMVDMNFGFMLVAIIGGMAAARGVWSCKKRNDIYWAGVRTGLVNALTIAFVLLLQKIGDPDLLSLFAWSVPAGFVGGILSSMVAMTFVPLLESMFNYTTDVKLLELASLNHALMKDMIVKAPGTYHHSLIVGSLCEAAAEEIGANALLAKVMAYYHDIGKMEHAQYFIENQRPGYNAHDHISPHMSKTVLIAHVKDGAEMGLQHKLGKPIIDGILQHHGTTLISFFYNKAMQEQDEDIDQVEADDFRYPGPKPQFREAALVMLADSIEAAARSLDEPTPARLQNIVKNIIQSKFLDGQLDECNLTLKDLSIIEATFKRVILGVYHQRIDYPRQPASSRPQPQVPNFPKSTKKSSYSV